MYMKFQLLQAYSNFLDQDEIEVAVEPVFEGSLELA